MSATRYWIVSLTNENATAALYVRKRFRFQAVRAAEECFVEKYGAGPIVLHSARFGESFLRRLANRLLATFGYEPADKKDVQLFPSLTTDVSDFGPIDFLTHMRREYDYDANRVAFRERGNIVHEVRTLHHGSLGHR